MVARALTEADGAALTALRHDLHRAPEVSGQEAQTAARVAALLAEAGADEIVTGLGGHGVAGVFNGGEPGPTVLFRAELDGLPIEELSDLPHRSQHPGRGHLCGHDGHMTLLAGLARLLERQRPARGRVVLMFQPAEETGQGAAAVAADPRFAALRPDFAFAIHNMPGLPLGACAIQTGTMACASRGLRIRLTGRTAHASEPENGLSPDLALAALIPQIKALSHGRVTDPDFTLATLCHMRLGVPAFGIAPGEAEIFVTLRTNNDDRMDALRARAISLVQDAAKEHGLTCAVSEEDIFVTLENTEGAVRLVNDAATALSIPRADMALPMRASEDFGGFKGEGDLAMIFLGSGTDCPNLHNPDYDYPDALTPIGVALFAEILHRIESGWPFNR